MLRSGMSIKLFASFLPRFTVFLRVFSPVRKKNLINTIDYTYILWYNNIIS